MKNVAKNCSENLAHTLQRALPSVGEVMCGLSYGCLGGWVSMSFKSLNIYTTLAESEGALDAVYLTSIIIVVLTLLAATSKSTPFKSWFKHPACPFVFGATMALATLLMPLGDISSSFGLTLVIIAGIVSGVSSGLLLLYIGYVFSFMTLRAMVIGAVVSSVSSTLFFALFLPLDALPALVISCAMPLLAAFFIWKGAKELSINCQETPVGENTLSADSASVIEPQELKALTIKFTLTAFFVGLANEIARTLYVQMDLVSAGGTTYAALQAWQTFACAVVLIVVALSLLNLKWIQKAACYSYHLLLVSLLFGVALLPLPLIIPAAGSLIPHAINAGALTCFGMLLWVVTVDFSAHCPEQRIQTFAAIRAGWAAGPLLGILIGRAVLSHGLQLPTVYLVTLLCISLIMLVETVIFSETDLMKAMDILPLERKRRFQEKCEQLIEAYGLTEREGEIMTMFAKGRNLPYIQETLFLSKSTVSTHRQHIYAKLNIHSQQELIDLVQNFEPKNRD